MKIIPAMVVAVLFASSAAAQSTSDPQASEEKKICKTEPVLGSRTRVKKTCMTKAEWALLAARTRDGLNDAVKDANTYTGGSSISYGPAGQVGAQ